MTRTSVLNDCFGSKSFATHRIASHRIASHRVAAVLFSLGSLWFWGACWFTTACAFDVLPLLQSSEAVSKPVGQDYQQSLFWAGSGQVFGHEKNV